jgi:hypothetical protein
MHCFLRTKRKLRVEVALVATLLLVFGSLFHKLNPITADSKNDNPTIRRSIGYARAELLLTHHARSSIVVHLAWPLVSLVYSNRIPFLFYWQPALMIP